MANASGILQPGDVGYIEPGKGLLNSSVGQTGVSPTTPVTGYTPAQATSSGYTPTPYTVTPSATVQEQVKSIVGNDSPLMQQAASIANQKANDRGLLNSSLGIGAAQNAVIAQALPIAQQDAQTFNQAMTNTTNQQNAASQFGAQAGNVASLTNADATNDAFKASLASATQLSNTQLNTQTQLALGNLDASTKTALTTMDNQYKQLLQTNSGASNAYVQAVSNIATIATNTTMDQTAKNVATQSQLNLLNEQLRVLGAVSSTSPQNVTALNLSQYFKDLGPSAIPLPPPPAPETNPNAAYIPPYD